MRFPAALFLASLLGGCTTITAAITGDDGGWLIGTWCPDQRGTTYAGVETMLAPTRFYADGSYATFEASGRWRFRDRALLLTQTGAPPIRRTDRVERLDERVMAWTMADGTREVWRRCRAAS